MIQQDENSFVEDRLFRAFSKGMSQEDAVKQILPNLEHLIKKDAIFAREWQSVKDIQDDITFSQNYTKNAYLKYMANNPRETAKPIVPPAGANSDAFKKLEDWRMLDELTRRMDRNIQVSELPKNLKDSRDPLTGAGLTSQQTAPIRRFLNYELGYDISQGAPRNVPEQSKSWLDRQLGKVSHGLGTVFTPFTVPVNTVYNALDTHQNKLYAVRKAPFRELDVPSYSDDRFNSKLNDYFEVYSDPFSAATASLRYEAFGANADNSDLSPQSVNIDAFNQGKMRFSAQIGRVQPIEMEKPEEQYWKDITSNITSVGFKPTGKTLSGEFAQLANDPSLNSWGSEGMKLVGMTSEGVLSPIPGILPRLKALAGKTQITQALLNNELKAIPDAFRQTMANWRIQKIVDNASKEDIYAAAQNQVLADMIPKDFMDRVINDLEARRSAQISSEFFNKKFNPQTPQGALPRPSYGNIVEFGAEPGGIPFIGFGLEEPSAGPLGPSLKYLEYQYQALEQLRDASEMLKKASDPGQVQQLQTFISNTLAQPDIMKLIQDQADMKHLTKEAAEFPKIVIQKGSSKKTSGGEYNEGTSKELRDSANYPETSGKKKAKP